jgi:hypothetical protein
VLCHWTVLIASLDATRFSATALWALYQVCFKYLLLFNNWKTNGGLAYSRGHTASRVLCEVLAELLAAVIQHWGTLLRGGSLEAVSVTQLCRRVWQMARWLAVGQHDLVVRWLRLVGGGAGAVTAPAAACPADDAAVVFAPRFAA